jgi:DNA-binding transcriptional regulator WhiA
MEFERWKEEELDFLRNNYQEKSYKEIGEILGRKEQAIRSKLHYLGLKKEVHHCNYDYFSSIDTEDKAYWLGFIYADGNVNKAQNTLTINLQAGDKEHLVKLNKCIDGNYSVKVTKDERNDKVYWNARLSVYSTKLVGDLINNGVVPNKTSVITFPTIQNNLLHHFIRGYFDGDGSVCERKHKKGPSDLACSFTCGNKSFLENIRKILFENNINSYIVHDKGNKTYLSLAGLQNPDNFLKYIYKDATIYLDRKMEKVKYLYQYLDIERRLDLQSEKAGKQKSEKENGNPEMEIRVEG